MKASSVAPHKNLAPYFFIDKDGRLMMQTTNLYFAARNNDPVRMHWLVRILYNTYVR